MQNLISKSMKILLKVKHLVKLGPDQKDPLEPGVGLGHRLRREVICVCHVPALRQKIIQLL